MKQVPMLHVTEVMASEFGVITATVWPLPATGVAPAQAFLVTDVDGGQWRLESCSVRQRAGRQRNMARSPARAGRGVVRRWGRQWTLIVVRSGASAQHAASSPSAMPAERQLELPVDGAHLSTGGGAGMSRVTLVEDPVLERVGSWLQQPAGLPMARDILGQCFMEAWLENRERIMYLHRHAERLHDALGGECGERAGDAEAAEVGEWHRLCHVLRQLADCQLVLIGSQAQVTPVALRRRALGRMLALLAGDAMRLRGGASAGQSPALRNGAG